MSFNGQAQSLGVTTNALTSFFSASPPMYQDADCLPHMHEPQCCCGSFECTFIRETQAAFDRLDESLRTAGTLGQVRSYPFAFPWLLSSPPDFFLFYDR